MIYKSALVCGLGLSGMAAASLLKRNGVSVTLSDIKEFEKVQAEVKLLAAQGIDVYLGKNPDDIIDKFDLIVMSPGIPHDLPYVEKAKALGKPIWSEIELAYSFTNAQIVAITGTNGKTTTTALTGEIFSRYRQSTRVVGNIGVPFTENCEGLKNDDYVVAEISSFQLEASHTFKPKASAVLNISPDHLNRHKTLECYVDTKKKIFENQDKSCYTVLNYDDEIVRKMAYETNANVLLFSTTERVDEGAFVDDGYITLVSEGKTERLIHKDELNILGKHNLENALAATLLAKACGIPNDIIIDALVSFKAVAHRLEFVKEIDGVSYYNDSKATNPDSAIKALDAIDAPVVLIAGAGSYDKGSDFSEWVKMFDGKVKYVVLFGDVSQSIAETMKAYGYNNYEKVNSLKQAVTLCRAKAEKGDCVLLSPACASWGIFDNYEQRGNSFKQFVLELDEAGD